MVCIDYFELDEDVSVGHTGHILRRRAKDLHAAIRALHKRMLALEVSNF
jgi:hypothetical protein